MMVILLVLLIAGIAFGWFAPSRAIGLIMLALVLLLGVAVFAQLLFGMMLIPLPFGYLIGVSAKWSAVDFRAKNTD
jgi:hypothetical protein